VTQSRPASGARTGGQWRENRFAWFLHWPGKFPLAVQKFPLAVQKFPLAVQKFSCWRDGLSRRPGKFPRRRGQLRWPGNQRGRRW
jgi:hypothetical protein